MPQRDRIVLIAFVAANLLLKLLWLGRNELAHDEPFTVYWAFRPWSEFLGMLGTENNPPFYFLLIRLWATVSPLDAGWLRLPSALFSTMAVWPLYLLGRRYGGTITAITAAVLFTLSAHHYGFAHEVRSYALFTLLTVTAFWQLMRMTDDQPRATFWLAMVNVLLVYTHFFGWVVIGLQALCVLGLKEMRPRSRIWAGIAAVTVLAYLPYAWIFFQRASESLGGTWLTAPTPEEVYNMVWRWSNAPVIAVALLALITITLVRRRMQGAGFGLAAIWTMVPLLGLFIVSHWVPVYLDRYLVFAAPGFALLAGLCVATLPGRTAPVAAMVLAIGMAVTFQPWRGNGLHPSAVVMQAEAWQGTGPVLLQPPYYDLTYAWHLDPELFRRTEDLRSALAHRGIHPLHTAEDLPAGQRLWETVVWVDAWAEMTDPQVTVKRALQEAYLRADSVEATQKVWVYRFTRK